MLIDELGWWMACLALSPDTRSTITRGRNYFVLCFQGDAGWGPVEAKEAGGNFGARQRGQRNGGRHKAGGEAEEDGGDQACGEGEASEEQEGASEAGDPADRGEDREQRTEIDGGGFHPAAATRKGTPGRNTEGD